MPHEKETHPAGHKISPFPGGVKSKPPAAPATPMVDPLAKPKQLTIGVAERWKKNSVTLQDGALAAAMLVRNLLDQAKEKAPAAAYGSLRKTVLDIVTSEPKEEDSTDRQSDP